MSNPQYRMKTIDEMFSADVVAQVNEAMRSFNESFTTGVQRAGHAVAAREEQRIMASEEDLLNVIAAAQKQLASLALIPREEPVDQERALFFAVETEPAFRSRYTYTVLRTTSPAEYPCWYITGPVATAKPKSWQDVREFFAGRNVKSWERLYTESQVVKMHGEVRDNTNEDLRPGEVNH